MIKNGTTGITDYSGKFKELCKPCFQAKQRAEDHGKEHQRHPNGRPGEHLHSDLAVLSTVDLNGNKYVLTVVDEASQEIVIALLRNKTATEVCRVCKKIQMLISARTRNKLLTWQFDRGTEFLNSTFEQWLKLELGVTQRFSNIEHPWENGKAERSFQTLFALSRSLLKHADLHTVSVFASTNPVYSTVPVGKICLSRWKRQHQHNSLQLQQVCYTELITHNSYQNGLHRHFTL